MLELYDKLLFSMMAWYRQWYRSETLQRKYAALAMSFLQVINFLSVMAALSGMHATVSNALDFATSNRIAGMVLFVGLILINLGLSEWRTGPSLSPTVLRSDISKKYAVIYILASLFVFVGSLVFMWIGRS